VLIKTSVIESSPWRRWWWVLAWHPLWRPAPKEGGGFPRGQQPVGPPSSLAMVLILRSFFLSLGGCQGVEIRDNGWPQSKVWFPLNIYRWRCNLGHRMNAPLIQGLLGTSRTFLKHHSVLYEPIKLWLGWIHQAWQEFVSITSPIFGILKLLMDHLVMQANPGICTLIGMNFMSKMKHIEFPTTFSIGTFYLTMSSGSTVVIFEKSSAGTYSRKFQISP
jgi:hypothetical protein